MIYSPVMATFLATFPLLAMSLIDWSLFAAQLASQLQQTVSTLDAQTANLEGTVIMSNNQVFIEGSRGVSAARAPLGQRVLYGRPAIATLVAALAEKGLSEVVVETQGDSEIIELPTHASSIIISLDHTEIVANDSALRAVLRDIVLTHLTEF
eukprot:m.195344 g.195344  ORF g.195344 m.195344 type:complete len:153 (-) comp53717_c0_seq11:1155-1613(-)